MSWFVYILRCNNGDLYTGITTHLERRYREHCSGKGGGFTNANRPTELLYHESHATESDAKRREAQIKGWSRRKKLSLISGDPKPLTRS
ncbi:MAG: GIY-YIG nuclease family protein [Candidatus Omnitrophota bacterium]|nr:GIY-YIG nuclease family protein [Candidatus Omnitrophota bacterium]